MRPARRVNTFAVGFLALLIAVSTTYYVFNKPTDGQSAIRSLGTVATGHNDGWLGMDNVSDLPETCGENEVKYPTWPDDFTPGVEAVFIIGEQKSGTTWMWHMLNAHPCMLSSNQPAWRQRAGTTKETYYFTSFNLSSDAREFLIPWMGFNRSVVMSDDAIGMIGPDWFDEAKKVSIRDVRAGLGSRVFTTPPLKATGFQKECSKYYILEATPHNLHTPIAAARIKRLFPNAKILASLKEPVARFISAFNQFGTKFKLACTEATPRPWCPGFKYFLLQLPTFSQAVAQELKWLTATGCDFGAASQTRSWKDCFGCSVMNPWVEPGLVNGPTYTPASALGMYAPMLATWLKFFPASSMRIHNYATVVANPRSTINNILQFLELEEYTDEQFNTLNVKDLGFSVGYKHTYINESMPQVQQARKNLGELYQPLNDQLTELCRAHNITWQPF